ncbi:hypothetical protein NMY22_g14970 [Coprinellus aureogranulatus]|nr:hypothetical protein NMY22_g14970 [Coprinellus aureogranulatus]
MRFPSFPSKSYFPGHIRWLYRLSHIPPSVSIFPLDVLQFTTIYPVFCQPDTPNTSHAASCSITRCIPSIFPNINELCSIARDDSPTGAQCAPDHITELRSSGVSFSVTTSSVRSRATALKMPGDTVQIKVEFSGGLELLFDNKRSHKLELPASVPKDNNTSIPPNIKEGEGKAADVAYLIAYLRDHLLQERAELFEEGGTVYVGFSHLMPGILIEQAAIDRRPGILVLVNDTDWELEGEGEYVLQDGDEIVFISTLHGG